MTLPEINSATQAKTLPFQAVLRYRRTSIIIENVQCTFPGVYRLMHNEGQGQIMAAIFSYSDDGSGKHVFNDNFSNGGVLSEELYRSEQKVSD